MTTPVHTILINTRVLYLVLSHMTFFFSNLDRHNIVCLFLYQNKMKIDLACKNLTTPFEACGNYNLLNSSLFLSLKDKVYAKLPALIQVNL